MVDGFRAGEHDLTLDITNSDASVIFRALGHPMRLRILEALSYNISPVTLLVEALDIPPSTLNQHLKVLEVAGLIKTELRPATRGTEKACARVYRKIEVNMVSHGQQAAPERAIEVSMPLGAYTDFDVTPPCGLASISNHIGLGSDPEAFVEPGRFQAQLLWFTTGYVEYRFPKRLPPRTVPQSLQLSVEVCSEAPKWNSDWPSDITMWINGREIGTWTSEADYGGRRGYLTPVWWSTENSQYGLLKTWHISAQGSFVDGIQVSDVAIDDLAILEHAYITVRIGIKPDAEFPGGVNIFGQQFGDYPQDIVLRLVYDKI